jgi:SAM-dependent methyltransferase
VVAISKAAEDVKRRMAVSSLPSAFAVPDLAQAEVRELRSILNGAGYYAAQDLRHSQGPAPMEGAPTRLQGLRRLFWQGAVLSGDEAAEAVAPLKAGALIRAGLLQESQGGVRALFQIQVYDGLYIIVDYMPREHPPDIVLPVGPSGKYLAEMTIRRPVEAALDLGCGSGIQALLMSRHARQVTATDINPRALALTRLNAELNGIYSIETIEGSYFEPLGDRTFDLIAANLPYVITPEKRHVYRDVGRPDDLPIQQTVQQAPRHLNEGGFAHLLLNWIHTADQPWWQPIEDWSRQRNADGWLLYSNSQTPTEYTKQWLLVDRERQPEEYARTQQAWLDWYEAQHIERIAFGQLTLRRRTARRNWRCFVAITRTASEPLGTHILHLFENQDALAGMASPAELLGRRLQPHMMKVESPAHGTFVARTTRAFLIQYRIHPHTARTIRHLDGKSELRTAIQKATAMTPWSRRKAMEMCCLEIHQLIGLGMIDPV